MTCKTAPRADRREFSRTVPSLSVTLAIGITSRPTFNPAWSDVLKPTRDMRQRTPHSGEDSEHIFEYRTTVGMLQDVSLRHLVTEIRNFHDGQNRSILADAAVTNLTSQPLPDRSATSPAERHLPACKGQGVYGLRR